MHEQVDAAELVHGALDERTRGRRVGQVGPSALPAPSTRARAQALADLTLPTRPVPPVTSVRMPPVIPSPRRGKRVVSGRGSRFSGEARWNHATDVQMSVQKLVTFAVTPLAAAALAPAAPAATIDVRIERRLRAGERDDQRRRHGALGRNSPTRARTRSSPRPGPSPRPRSPQGSRTRSRSPPWGRLPLCDGCAPAEPNGSRERAAAGRLAATAPILVRLISRTVFEQAGG